MSKKIGYYKFHRLSKTEQQALKAAGYKVKMPIGTYFVGAVAVVVMLQTCGKSDAPVESYPWSKANASCVNAVRQATKSGLMEVKSGSNKDWGKDGYAVKVLIEKDYADFSVMCYAKSDGTVVKLDSASFVFN